MVGIVLIMQMHKLAITKVMYEGTTEGNAFGQLSEQDQLNADGLSSFDRYFFKSSV